MNTPHDLFHSAFHAVDIDAPRRHSPVSTVRPPLHLLAKLLLEHCHETHEDIVSKLGLIGELSTTVAITKAAEMRFEHLIDWDSLRAFQCKCAYALARIGTTEMSDPGAITARAGMPSVFTTYEITHSESSAGT